MKDRRKSSLERLKHIDGAIISIREFTKKSSEKDFLSNKVLSNAVLFEFSVIGEAIHHVEESILKRYAYPWHKARAFRNLIAHEYFNIRLEAVWQIIIKDLPELQRMVRTILESEQ